VADSGGFCWPPTPSRSWRWLTSIGGPGEEPEPAVPQPDPTVGEPGRPTDHEVRCETLPTTPEAAGRVRFRDAFPESLAGLHEFGAGTVGERLYRLVVLGVERVALVVVQTKAVRDTPRRPALQRGERVPVVNSTQPVQRQVLLTPGEHPPGPRIECLDSERRSVDGPGRRERRYRQRRQVHRHPHKAENG